MELQMLDLYSPLCPICAGAHFQPLASNDRYGMQLQTVGCMGCGLLQTWPRPVPAAMAAFYRDRYRQYYQSTAAPSEGYAASFNKGERLAYTARLIAQCISLVSGARVLDVGCAEGTLFKEMAKVSAGLDFVGIEPSPTFSAYARESTGCKTYSDMAALLASREEEFDLIVVNHVLEHVDDPVSFLAGLVTVLAPGGCLYIDVPDADRYSTPESLHIAHLFHFTPRTLRAVAARAGFRAVSLGCHRPPHHPDSVWILAEAGAETDCLPATSVESERAAWDAVRALRRKLPRYLFKRAVGRNRAVVKFVRGMHWLRNWRVDK